MSKYFSEVFKKLVPSGHAQLVMKTADGDEGDDGTAEPSDSDRFIGVGEEINYTRTKFNYSVEYNKQNLFKNLIYFFL